MSKPVATNSIGLTAVRSWDSSYTSSPPLLDQLNGLAHTVHQLPLIVGMGGNAYLVCYTSPRTSKPVTVLVIPQRTEVDQFGEDYFYFEGMDELTALAGDFEDRWAHLYDQARLYTVEPLHTQDPIREDAPMTTTTQYGTWHTLTGGTTATLEDSVAEFLGEFEADFDADQVAADYRAAINDVLPDGVTLNGDIVYGPAEGVTEFDPEAAREAIAEIDLSEIAKRHDRTTE